MTNKQKKEYLSQYRKLRHVIKSLSDEIDAIRAAEMGSAINYTGMPHGSNIRDLSDYAARLDKLTRKLYRKKTESLRAINRIERAISRMPNERYQALLRDRYINCKTWERLAVEYGYDDVRGIYYLHGKALEEFRF